MYEANLGFDKDEKLLKILEEQENSFKHSRASYTIKQEENKTKILVKAKDSSSLRATLNSICVTLSIYEKAKNI